MEIIHRELDELTAKVVETGLATWSDGTPEEKRLIVRGQAHLLESGGAMVDLERIRQLFEDLEEKREVVRLLGAAQDGEGVRIFIGAENKLFSLSGSSLIVPLPRQPAAHRGRAGRDRADTAELRAHNPMVE